MSQLHELKTDPEPFKQVWHARKTFELRRDDRNFKVGDVLHLRELERRVELFNDKTIYTGRGLLVLVIYLLRGPEYGLPEDFVVMSIKLLTRLDGGQPVGM